MPNYISVSQINLYILCSLKYRFTYIDLLEKPFKPAGLAFGSAFHSALEWLHKRRRDNKPITVGDIISIFKADWYAQNCDSIRFKKGDSHESLAEMGEKLILKYFEELPPVLPRDIEVGFQIPFVNPETGEVLDRDFKGVIDLIEEDGTIVEHKTSARVLDESAIDGNFQLSAYSYAYRYLFNRKESGIRIDNMVKTKRPRIERFKVQRNETDYVRLFHIAQTVICGIENGIFFPNPGWMCADCEFADHCRSWKGLRHSAVNTVKEVAR